MNITELNTYLLTGGQTKITWLANGRSCEFITGLQLSFGEVENWVNGLDKSDMVEMYTGYVMKNPRTDFERDPNIFGEFTFIG